MPTDQPFLKACQGQYTDTIPVWFMRQAGRYQPEYRKLRHRYSLLDMVRDPELCTEVTCRPVEDLGVDAAILFSDIMVPLGPMGISFQIEDNVGPVIREPVRTLRDIERLRTIEPAQDLPYMLDSVDRIVKRLGLIPLIGFSGAPFTLASYVIEGGPSRDYFLTKKMMWTDRETWQALMDRLSETVVRHLTAQVQAGAKAVQLFDSWVGTLSVDDYRRSVLPYVQQIISRLAPLSCPVIYFGVGSGELLESMAESGATVLGVDWRTPLARARRWLGPQVALQGNLDPATLLSGWPTVEERARGILHSMRREPGYIFNLGHGVPKETDPDVLRRLVDLVHRVRKEEFQ